MRTVSTSNGALGRVCGRDAARGGASLTQHGAVRQAGVLVGPTAARTVGSGLPNRRVQATGGLQAATEMPPGLKKIVGAFQMVPDAMARYKQLLYFASKLDPLPQEFHVPENKVHGCVSQVWVRANLDDGKVFFRADSDSQLTKGLAALLVQGLSGSPPQDILSLKPDFIEMLGLKQSLTPSRSNGFLNMFKMMQRRTLELATERSQEASSTFVAEAVQEPSNGTSPPDGATPVLDSIQDKLSKGLAPMDLEVVDESAQHSGHAGARDTDSPSGETHFRVAAVSEVFEGLSLVQRHKKVYQLLADEMSGPVHALSLDLKAPGETS